MWLFFVTQYNSSLSSFVPNFRILTLVAEKSLTEKKFTDKQNRQTDKHNYRKGKNYIPPIYSYRGIIPVLCLKAWLQPSYVKQSFKLVVV